MEFLILLAVLVCPVVMGGMMCGWMFRMRGHAPRDREDDQQ